MLLQETTLREKIQLVIGHVLAFQSGVISPTFLYVLGDVIDSYNKDNSTEVLYSKTGNFLVLLIFFSVAIMLLTSLYTTLLTNFAI